MNSKYKIIMSSDIQYDELCAEIYFEDEFLAILTQEQGLEHMEIDIHPRKNNKFWTFKFSEFEAVLHFAKNALWEMQKLPEE